MLKTQKLIEQINILEKLYGEVYPLIEGLSLSGNHDSDESPLHYFSQATDFCNKTEAWYDGLIGNFSERIEMAEGLIARVAEWDMKAEGLTSEDIAVHKKTLKRRNQAAANILKKIKALDKR